MGAGGKVSFCKGKTQEGKKGKTKLSKSTSLFRIFDFATGELPIRPTFIYAFIYVPAAIVPPASSAASGGGAAAAPALPGPAPGPPACMCRSPRRRAGPLEE